MSTGNTTPPKLDRLYQQRAQLSAKIKQLEARSKAQARRDDARRKIIAGALALEHASKDEAFGRTLHQLIGRYVSRTPERALFGLPPLKESEQDNQPDASGASASSTGK